MIERYDISDGSSRLVIHNGVAYFTGHVSPKFSTLKEQTAGLCRRYDELFDKFGLKKENIIMMNAYLKDIAKLEEFNEEWDKWVGTENAPAGVAVQAPPDQTSEMGDNLLVELALIVAVDESYKEAANGN